MQIIVGNVIYFEHLQNEQILVPNRSAPDVTHSRDFEHERLGAHHVDAIVLPMLQMKQNDA